MADFGAGRQKDMEQKKEKFDTTGYKTFQPVSQDYTRLLQNVFRQMVEGIADVRTRNLVAKYIKDYPQVEKYLNDSSLIHKWHGAGQQSVERISLFLNDFYQEYLQIVGGQSGETAKKLIAVDYPFLTDEERIFAVSFLQSEGRYPVLFIASRYLQRTTDRQAQVFARANGIVGGHIRFETIGEEYRLTRERVRQLSVMSITNADDAGQVWNYSRWRVTGWLQQPLLTEEIVGWDECRQKERLEDIDFYAALAIIRQVASLNIVALRADGRRANARLTPGAAWQMPDVLFAYDKSMACFSFENALAVVGHEASLQRMTDGRMALSDVVDQHFIGKHGEEERRAVISVMHNVLPLFNHVETEGDDIVFRANRTNYTEDIYQILQRKGQAMTIDEIYEEFRRLHPDDHHTESKFIRSYMLRDERFEAVGSKSTYQLREWGRFAGALGDLAVHLLEESGELMKVNELCQRMLEARPATTLKSCYTSIYLAVNSCRLLYFIDDTANSDDNMDEIDRDMGRYYVGLFDHQYPERFWPSPLTVEGAIRSMRRFVEIYERWPFPSAKAGVEHKLYYALRKYATKRCVSDDEMRRYQQAMADINPDEYPANERDQQFLDDCHELQEYCERYHHLPLNGKLLSWYKSQCSKAEQLAGFRRFQLQQLQTAVSSLCKPSDDSPVVPIGYGSHQAEQLTLDFLD